MSMYDQFVIVFIISVSYEFVLQGGAPGGGNQGQQNVPTIAGSQVMRRLLIFQTSGGLDEYV